MENKSLSNNVYNDSDIGYYFDDYFVEEVRKEIKDTLVSFKSEVEEECISCDIEFKNGFFICSDCGKRINP